MPVAEQSMPISTEWSITKSKPTSPNFDIDFFFLLAGVREDVLPAQRDRAVSVQWCSFPAIKRFRFQLHRRSSLLYSQHHTRFAADRLV